MNWFTRVVTAFSFISVKMSDSFDRVNTAPAAPAAAAWSGTLPLSNRLRASRLNLRGISHGLLVLSSCGQWSLSRPDPIFHRVSFPNFYLPSSIFSLWHSSSISHLLSLLCLLSCVLRPPSSVVCPLPSVLCPPSPVLCPLPHVLSS